MFVQNKYTDCYYRIINKAKTRNVEDYCESHHIIPKSLGGSNGKDNLVRLTAKEHFICHLLLVKMTTGKEKRKMSFALHTMTRSSKKHNRYVPTSSQYEKIRKEFRVSVSESMIEISKNRNYKGENNPFYGKTHTTESKNKTTGTNHYTKRLDYDENKHPSKQPGWSENNSKSQIGIPKPILICEHCRQTVGGHGNYKRWHGDNCKKVKVSF